MQPRAQTITFVDIHSITDEKQMIALLKDNGALLRYAPKFWHNFNAVFAAVTNEPLALQYASPMLQNNETIVRAAMAKNIAALQYASLDLKNNKAFIRDFIPLDPWIIIIDASATLKTDPELLQLALQINPKLFDVLSKEQKDALNQHRAEQQAFFILNQAARIPVAPGAPGGPVDEVTAFGAPEVPEFDSKRK